MNKTNRLTIFFVTTVLALACSTLTQGLPATEETPTNEPFSISTIPVLPTDTTVPVPANLLFSDDFSVQSAELETFSDDNGSTETRDGVYVVRAISDLWHWGRSASQFSDTVIEFDVKMAAGPSNNNVGFGAICRLSEREDTSIDGYMLAISADGYYTIRSITSSSMSPLVDWSYSDVVKQGSATNKIRATCSGSDLKLEVNGATLAEASTISGGSSFGSIAFAAISFESENRLAEVHFDNLVVSSP